MKIYNVHERKIHDPRTEAEELLNSLSSNEDRLWPHEKWPPQKFDTKLEVGAKGGHTPITYEVEAFEPGSHVRYRFGQDNFFPGHHWFTLRRDGGDVLLRHVISGETHFFGWLRWAILIRPLHDALLEDAFDKAELDLAGELPNPVKWSAWVRCIRWSFGLVLKKN